MNDKRVLSSWCLLSRVWKWANCRINVTNRRCVMIMLSYSMIFKHLCYLYFTNDTFPCYITLQLDIGVNIYLIVHSIGIEAITNGGRGSFIGWGIGVTSWCCHISILHSTRGGSNMSSGLSTRGFLGRVVTGREHYTKYPCIGLIWCYNCMFYTANDHIYLFLRALSIRRTNFKHNMHEQLHAQ